MFKLIAMVLFAAGMTGCRTSNRGQQQHSQLTENVEPLVVDSDGRRYSVKRMTGDKVWLITNLNLDIPCSYCYNDTAAYCERFGRLYTWAAAQKGCAMLGEGWRLPSKEDWFELAGFTPDVIKDTSVIRKEAYHNLLSGGPTLFNAVLGGGRTMDGGYRRSEAHGFYWTRTEADTATAWFANFAKGSQSLFIQKDGEKIRAFSVRCIKDGKALK
jgi:uncharacterized protein (TIGR02145 family)